VWHGESHSGAVLQVMASLFLVWQKALWRLFCWSTLIKDRHIKNANQNWALQQDWHDPYWHHKPRGFFFV
jgi:hypothetical protein